MRSRLLLNVFLLVVVAALGWLYWNQPEPEVEQPQAISDIDIDGVEHIEVIKAGGPTIKLTRQDDDWRLIEPRQADAEDSRVDSILMLPLSASESRFSTEDQKLEEFGLQPAQLTLSFDGKKFVVGDQNPLNEQQRYVLYQDQIHLIDNRLYQRLNAPLNYYVNPSLTPPDTQLTRVHLPDGILSQQGETWRVIPARLTDKPVEAAKQWQSARASYVKTHDKDQSVYVDQITLEFADHEPIQYGVVATDPQIILARDEFQYHLRSDMGAKLLLNVPPADTGNGE